MTLLERIRAREIVDAPCVAIASNGDRCTRSDPHGPSDLHQRGIHQWGAQVPPRTRWQDQLAARDFTGRASL